MDVPALGADITSGLLVGPVQVKKGGNPGIQLRFTDKKIVMFAHQTTHWIPFGLVLLRFIFFEKAHRLSR